MLQAIIFSKSRPAQLDLLLTSIETNLPIFDYITVIHRATNVDFYKGYDIVEDYHQNVTFLNEDEFETNSFKQELIREVKLGSKYTVNNDQNFTCFFTDDDIVYRNHGITVSDIYWLFEANQVCFSLRLGKNVTKCNHHDDKRCYQPPFIPIMDNKFIAWNRFAVPGFEHFGYAFSIDGCFYRNSLLYEAFSQYEFNHPNLLEGNAQPVFGKFPHELMCAGSQSSVVGIPVNRVQDIFTNKAGLFYPASPEELNKRFLDGERIHFEDLVIPTINGVHDEIELIMRKG